MGSSFLKASKFALAIYFTTCFVLTLIFVENYSISVFSRDSFRHLTKIIIPFLENWSLNWNLLWSNHHPSPLLHLHQMFNLYVFRGDLRFDAYFGAVAQLIIGLIFIRLSYLQMSKKYPTAHATNVVLSLAIGIVSIALIESSPYTWPLVSIQNYFLITGIGVAYFTYKVVEQKASLKSALGLVVMVFFAMLTHKSYGSIFTFSAAAVLLFQCLVYRDKRIFVCGISVLSTLLIYDLVIIDMLYMQHNASSEIQVKNLSIIFSYFTAFGKAIFGALHGQTLSSNTPHFIFFFYGSLFALCTLWASLQRDRLVIVAVLMVAVTVFGIGAALFRNTSAFPHGISAPRYILNYKVGGVSMIWVIFVALRQYVSQKVWSSISIALVVGLVCNQLFAMKNIFRVGKSVAVLQNSAAVSLYIYGTDKKHSNFKLPFVITGYNNDFVLKPAINYLVEKELNVFYPKYNSSENLKNYINASKEQFENIGFETKIEPKSCTTKVEAKAGQTWELRLSSQTAGRFMIRGVNAKNMIFRTYPGDVRLLGVFDKGGPFQFCLTNKAEGDFYIYNGR